MAEMKTERIPQSAGIGSGDEGDTGGKITISGGTVKCENCQKYAAAIGGGDGSIGGDILISGGNVTAKGCDDSPAVGGGDGKDIGHFKMTGGSLNAEGGKNGAAIGTGNDTDFEGTVEFYGGSANLKGDYTPQFYYGDGTHSEVISSSVIGAGREGDFEGTISFYGGHVTANYPLWGGSSGAKHTFGPGSGGKFKGTINIGDYMQVKEGNLVDVDKRVERLSSESYAFTVEIMECNHSEVNYVYDETNPSQHIRNCKYCKHSELAGHNTKSTSLKLNDDLSSAILTIHCSECRHDYSETVSGDMLTSEVIEDTTHKTYGKRRYTGVIKYFGREIRSQLTRDIDERDTDLTDIRGSIISGVDRVNDWTGETVQPEPIVQMPGKVLTKGVDYDVTYSNSGLDIGMHTLTINGKGSYSGSVTMPYYVRIGVSFTGGEGSIFVNKAFDKMLDLDFNTKWDVDGHGIVRGYFQFERPIKPSGYVITTANDTAKTKYYLPTSWKLKAKLDQSDDWTIISEFNDDNTIEAKNNASYRFDIEKEGVYKYFCFEVTRSRRGDMIYSVSVELAELTIEGRPADYDLSTASISGLYYDWTGEALKPEPTVKIGEKVLTEGVDYDLTYSGTGANVGVYSLTVTGKGEYEGSKKVNYYVGTGVTATEGSKGAIDRENYQYLVDGKEKTKWYVKNNNGQAYIEFHYDQPIRTSGYVLTTANDTANFGSRNPKSWTLKAKLGESDEWITIATVTNDLTLEAKNFEAYRYNIQKEGIYKYFRFEVSEVRSGKEFQLSELTIEGQPLDNDKYDISISGVSSYYECTGEALQPKPTVTTVEKVLTEGVDYDVVYSGLGVNVGAYTLTVTCWTEKQIRSGM